MGVKERTRKPKIKDPIEQRLNTLQPVDSIVLKQELPSPQTAVNEDGDRRSRHKSHDPITAALRCEKDGYYHRMTWNWFKEMCGGVGYRMHVDRYYQSKKLAVDLGENHDTKIQIALKKQLLQEHGISYYRLQDIEDVNRMMAEIGLQ